jgi:hypothetical protein
MNALKIPIVIAGKRIKLIFYLRYTPDSSSFTART